MKSVFDPKYILEFIPKLVEALPVTLLMTAVAMVGGLLLGFVLAIININQVPAIIFVFIAFILNEAAYLSEIIRATILSIDKNEIEAAMSLGMTNFQTMRRVILPQALLVALPILGNTINKT